MTVRDAMMHMTGLGWGGRAAPFGVATEATRRDRGVTVGRRRREPARRRLDARRPRRPARGATAALPSRRALVLFGVDRRVRPARRDHLRPALRRVPRRDDLRRRSASSDTGFVVPDDKIDRFAANYGRARDKSLRLVEDPMRERLPQAARVPVGRRRAGLDDGRLPPLRADAVQRRRARRCAHPRPQDGRAHDAEPSARRR